MRMRARMLAVVAGILAASPAASADDLDTWHDITFTAPIPCAVACPYWLDALNHDTNADGKEDVYFEVCESPDGTADELETVPGLPFAKGTVFDDVVVGPAPAGTRLLEWQLFPALDWDGFICEWLPGDIAGREIPGPICVCEPTDCDSAVPGGLLGCPEAHTIEVQPGRRYILRAYNWSDTMPLPARYRFREV